MPALFKKVPNEINEREKYEELCNKDLPTYSCTTQFVKLNRRV